MRLSRWPVSAYFRALGLGVWLIISCIIGLFVCVWKFHDPDVPRIITTYIYSPLSLIIGGWRIHHRDYHKIPKTSAVYMGNHQSVADLLIFGSATPRNCVCVAKSELKWVPVFGLFWYASGNIFIERKKLASAKQSLDEATSRLRDNQCSMWVFPEGTRNYKSPGTTCLPFKKGPFHMAIGAQVPIVPVVCSNQTRTFDPNNGHWRGGDIVLQALDPIPTKGKTAADINDLIALTRSRMEAAMRLLDAELEELARLNMRVGDDGADKVRAGVIERMHGAATASGGGSGSDGGVRQRRQAAQ
mmetsp:Transcript_27909/g.67821  ORF Transcript_27909/g.67821 Transcript_27909/m.67821 type:complete len:301 (-) Transcript_27909:101-1003(-)